jgi:hypothetical protein
MLGRWKEHLSTGPFPRVTSSWINMARFGQRSINQISHNHVVYGTTMTGTYYVTSGWSDPANHTNIQLVRPGFMGSEIGGHTIAFKPDPGMLVIWPTYLKHAADVHTGDMERVAVAFNAV